MHSNNDTPELLQRLWIPLTVEVKHSCLYQSLSVRHICPTVMNDDSSDTTSPTCVSRPVPLVFAPLNSSVCIHLCNKDRNES